MILHGSSEHNKAMGVCNEDIKIGLLRLSSITNRGPQKAILLTN